MSRPTAFIGSRSYQLFGGEVDDILSCGDFTDILSGGAGANTFVCAGQAANTRGVDRIVDFDVQGRDVLEFTGHSPIVEYTCCSTRLTMQDQETVAQRTLRIGVIVAVAILLAASQGLYSALSEKGATS
ncbi:MULTISPECIES: hypothetical protein [unclassified Ensifer]|uniref:hypothetical protein n=1 Tax=unclassified Ensifer TaxID=2633371 RepID=UPI00087E6939|nr:MULTISPECIES: hypothetical protein [unclassified Ensifer]MBD9595885.1 hypothetical protein [Ensifer sp. ENS05]SDN14418.1 hypothetical protein SAMN05216328_119112 [Ensifer sp. YR511]